MMVSRQARLGVALTIAVFALVGSANAWVSWTQPSGTTSFFDYSGGGSDTGLFGDPTVIDQASNVAFAFTPQAFRAESENGVAQTTDDRLEFHVAAHSGYQFNTVKIVERGDYGILGGGSVSATAGLFLNDWNNFRFEDDAASVTYTTDGSGNWTLTTQIDLVGDFPEWTDFDIVLDNNLMAISDPSGTTFIQKKLAGVAIDIIVIPEPTTFLLLGLGLL
ncbi:MAG: hypothetical protein JXO22_14645, partial [Phycisphaerae bacterium]|nr:hypothetical protein [Phycisphaerae bacterium]